MKLEVGLLNVLTVADSDGSHMVPNWVGMRHPAYGKRDSRGRRDREVLCSIGQYGSFGYREVSLQSGK
jgi:hypothetical protein